MPLRLSGTWVPQLCVNELSRIDDDDPVPLGSDHALLTQLAENADGNLTLAVVDSRPHQGAPAVASSSALDPVVGVPSADRGRVRAS